MKYFTKAIDKYFASWILRDTWHTKHPNDMARFYRFVFAIDRFSKPIKNKYPIQDIFQEGNGSKLSKSDPGYSCNPRTYDEQALREKIILAVKRNHANFKEASAEELADLIEEYVRKAMFILNILWTVKNIGFPHIDIQKWKPPLK